MNELQKKLKELVKKGELAQEEFDEISTKMEFVEEPQEPEKPISEEPSNEPAPAEKVEEKVDEKVKEEMEPELLPVQDENTEPEVKPEKPQEPIEEKVEEKVEDERLVNLQRKVDDFENMINGYEGRIKAMEDVIASLGEPVKKEEAEEFGNNEKAPSQENAFANDTDSILNRPGMGGVHR